MFSDVYSTHFCVDPKCESRKSRPFYVPSDERFDYLKLSDNKADLVRAGGHAISSKIEAKLMNKADFDSIEEVWKLYAPKGNLGVGGINNVLPGKVDVDKHDQYPLAFLQELTARRADGENNHPLRFPVPQVVQGMLLQVQGRNLGLICCGVGLNLQVTMYSARIMYEVAECCAVYVCTRS